MRFLTYKNIQSTCINTRFDIRPTLHVFSHTKIYSLTYGLRLTYIYIFTCYMRTIIHSTYSSRSPPRQVLPARFSAYREKKTLYEQRHTIQVIIHARYSLRVCHGIFTHLHAFIPSRKLSAFARVHRRYPCCPPFTIL